VQIIAVIRLEERGDLSRSMDGLSDIARRNRYPAHVHTIAHTRVREHSPERLPICALVRNLSRNLVSDALCD